MKGNNQKPDALKEKSLDFAVRIVNLNKFLRDQKKEYVISKQILRSGTNPGAMVYEAKNAESGVDFIHKLAVAQKETGETQFWLTLLYRTDYISKIEYESMYNDSTEIMKLLRSSIITRKQNLGLKAITILLIISSLIYFF